MNITDVLRQEKNWVIIGDTSNPEKYANKIYNEKFIKNIRKRKNIILLVINIIYIFLFNYYNFGRMVTYACGFNFLSVVIAIILKWKEEE